VAESCAATGATVPPETVQSGRSTADRPQQT
jgi:hypothetical protein